MKDLIQILAAGRTPYVLASILSGEKPGTKAHRRVLTRWRCWLLGLHLSDLERFEKEAEVLGFRLTLTKIEK